ncbi:Lyzozyme M1 [Candidatus Terasakiella magnetica]|nr:Lyzozyme M1 [Candidatus Terasakiella magnetica]
MMKRRELLAGLALGLAGCAPPPPLPRPAVTRAKATPGLVDEPALLGLNAVIDLHHANTVRSFAQARDKSGILGVIHKASEGDWRDPRHDERRAMAEGEDLLWGSYHFGTRQHPGAVQAHMFLDAAKPSPQTLLVLDLELNERSHANTMELAAAEDFVRTVFTAQGRWPVLYVHPAWADGEPLLGRTLGGAITAASPLATCDLWLADYRYEPELPAAWSKRGWTFWQFAGDNPVSGGPFRDQAAMVAGIDRCDRSVFAGPRERLIRYWTAEAGRGTVS